MEAVVVDDWRSLKKYLLRHDHPMGCSDKYWQTVRNKLSAYTKRKAIVTVKPGFHGCKYLCRNGRVIGKKGGYGPLLHPEANIGVSFEERKGELSEWKEHVAALALHSQLGMLSLCSAFAGFVIPFCRTPIESGGYHIWGASSTGKTTCFHLASSVFGGANSFIHWKSTETALEETAVAHNHSMLFLDELHLIDPSAKSAAEKATDATYSIAAGAAKKRSTTYREYCPTWQLVVLSSGEQSLTQQSIEGGRPRPQGAQARIVDIPAGNRNRGAIFQSMPEEFCGDEGKFVEYISEVCGKYHGTAKDEFLKEFTDELHRKGREFVGELIHRRMSEFLDKVGNPEKLHRRIAKRFALTYAAAYFACRYRVLDFKKKRVLADILTCYDRAIEELPKTDEEMLMEAEKQLSKIMSSSHTLDVREKNHGFEGNQLLASPCLKALIGKVEVIAVDPGWLDELIGSPMRQLLISRAKSQGKLYLDKRGKPTRQVSKNIKGVTLRRMYCFYADKLD